MVRAVIVLAVVGGIVVLSAQTSAPAFEVASVKPNLESAGSQTWAFLPSGRFVATNTPLRMLIQNAYSLSQNRLLGGPDWIHTERFDILASAPEGTPESRMQTMLQQLLAERFKLVIRKEAQEGGTADSKLTKRTHEGKAGPTPPRSETSSSPIHPLR